MGTNVSEQDATHLDECFDAYGLGESISNGYLTDRFYDSDELNEAARKIEEGVRVVRRIYAGM